MTKWGKIMRGHGFDFEKQMKTPEAERLREGGEDFVAVWGVAARRALPSYVRKTSFDRFRVFRFYRQPFQIHSARLFFAKRCYHLQQTSRKCYYSHTLSFL